MITCETDFGEFTDFTLDKPENTLRSNADNAGDTKFSYRPPDKVQLMTWILILSPHLVQVLNQVIKPLQGE